MSPDDTPAGGEPEFTIDDDDSTNMSAMPVTDPAAAPTMNQDTTFYPTLEEEHERTVFGPSGHWSAGVFACFDTFFSALFWMACCCTPCLYGQLLQRLNLTWCGQTPRTGRANSTCMVLFALTTVVYCVLLLTSDGGWFYEVILWVFVIYCFFVGFLLRSVLRQRFGIAPSTLPECDGMLEDCLLALCCSCCSSIQMARHTHDERRYPYNPCSSNGLLSYAPDLIDNQSLWSTTSYSPSGDSRHSTVGQPVKTTTEDMSNVEIV